MSKTQPLREYKLVVVGGGGVGKSALTIQFSQNHFVDEYDPTIEASTMKWLSWMFLTLPAKKSIRTSPHFHTFSAMREQYMRTGEGFLLVYSMTSRSSFEEISTYYHQILRVKDRDQFPMVLVANKCDLEQEREITTAEGYAFAREIGCPFVETSAKQRVNVDEAFNDLVREIRRFNKELNPLPGSAPGHLASQPNDAVGKGCKCVVM